MARALLMVPHFWDPVCVPLGVSSLNAYAARAGHTVALFDFNTVSSIIGAKRVYFQEGMRQFPYWQRWYIERNGTEMLATHQIAYLFARESRRYADHVEEILNLNERDSGAFRDDLDIGAFDWRPGCGRWSGAQRGEIVLAGDHLGTRLGAARDNAFHTGDLGFLAAGGELFVTGRISAFLKNRGFRVSPHRVESLLMTMHGIRDCRVLTRDGRLVAEIMADRGDQPRVRRIIGYLEERLPAYYVPDRFDFVSRVPRTRSGKIKRT